MRKAPVPIKVTFDQAARKIEEARALHLPMEIKESALGRIACITGSAGGAFVVRAWLEHPNAEFGEVYFFEDARKGFAYYNRLWKLIFHKEEGVR